MLWAGKIIPESQKIPGLCFLVWLTTLFSRFPTAFPLVYNDHQLANPQSKQKFKTPPKRKPVKTHDY